jgi:hypothetical protein
VRQLYPLLCECSSRRAGGRLADGALNFGLDEPVTPAISRARERLFLDGRAREDVDATPEQERLE